MRRRWRRVRSILPVAVAYGLALLFLVGLLIDRRPAAPAAAGPEAAVPALGGLGRAPSPAVHGSHEEGGTGLERAPAAPFWLRLFRPDAPMARRLLEQAIPLLDAYGSPGLVLYGDAGPASPPASVFQAMFPFLRGRQPVPLRPWSTASRGEERGLLPESGVKGPGPAAPGGGTDPALPPDAGGSGPPAGPDPSTPGHPGPAVPPDRPPTPAPGASGVPAPPRSPVAGRACGSNGVPPVADGQPLVGLYHTHDYESYISEFPRWVGKPLEEWGAIESQDPAHNIIRVGARLAEALCERGVTVVHSPARHAYTYLGAYLESQKTVQKILREYPTVQVLIDVHRDSGVGRKTTTAEVGGQPVARPMFVVGQGRASDLQPLYQENLAWAKRVNAELEQRYPGLSRGVLSKPYWYNQNFRRGALLIEIGSVENSMEEALRTADLLAGVLADLARSDGYPN